MSAPLTLDFNWTDAHATIPVRTWTNHGWHDVYLESLAVVNGTTAGSATPGVVTVKTSEAEYTITGPATLAAGAVLPQDPPWNDRIKPGDSLTVFVTTAAGSAKEGSVRFTVTGERE